MVTVLDLAVYFLHLDIHILQLLFRLTGTVYTILYASECWAPTKTDVAHLDAFDQWCLRRPLGIIWQDHITNIEVSVCTGLPAVSETISPRRLSMLGHMPRMPPSADAYKAIYHDIRSDWRRRPGRPRQSWLATIHRDLRKLDIDLDNVPEPAANHVLWRGLIRGATHHSGACYYNEVNE